jgi:hypothetical protein
MLVTVDWRAEFAERMANYQPIITDRDSFVNQFPA